MIRHFGSSGITNQPQGLDLGFGSQSNKLIFYNSVYGVFTSQLGFGGAYAAGNYTVSTSGTININQNTWSSSLNTGSGAYSTLINFVGIKKIFVKYSTRNMTGSGKTMRIALKQTTAWDSTALASYNFTTGTETDKTISLDISAVNASATIWVDLYSLGSGGGGSAGSNQIIITEIWGEM